MLRIYACANVYYIPRKFLRTFLYTLRNSERAGEISSIPRILITVKKWINFFTAKSLLFMLMRCINERAFVRLRIIIFYYQSLVSG